MLLCRARSAVSTVLHYIFSNSKLVMLWHQERFLFFRNCSKKVYKFVCRRAKWSAVSVWDLSIFSFRISQFSSACSCKRKQGVEREASLMIRTWSRYVGTQIATGPFSSLWETMGIEWASKRTDANALSSLQCAISVRKTSHLKMVWRTTCDIKFSSLRETIVIASVWRLSTNALSSLSAVESLSSASQSPSSSLCMPTVCYYHVSVLPLNRYFGRMAVNHHTMVPP